MGILSPMIIEESYIEWFIVIEKTLKNFSSMFHSCQKYSTSLTPAST